MRKELAAILPDGDVPVVVQATADGWILEVAGRTYALDAVQVGPHQWSVRLDDRAFLVDVEVRAGAWRVTTGLAELVVALEDAQRRKLQLSSAAVGGRTKSSRVLAPIAGKVVKVCCAAGDSVAAGQPLLVLEAMKMENELLAERDGVIRSISVTAGQSVETNELLLEYAG